MKREVTQRISWFLDRILPPIIRENRLFYRLILKQVVGGDVEAYLNFRENAWKMSLPEMQEFYSSIYSNISRPTDCSEASVQRVIGGLVGESVLEFGCGRGYLAELIIKQNFEYTGVDFDTSMAKEKNSFRGSFVNATSLDPISTSFDTVVCTHTLEHVNDIRKYVNDLRKRARKRLIIVIPLQINLYYTPDLHTYFFRRPGDFFLAAGFTGSDKLSYWVDGSDLCAYLDL